MTMPKIFIAGHKGMVGSAIWRQLALDSKNEILTADHKDLDLCCQYSVRQFLERYNVDQIYLTAAKVGGVYANNTYPAEFIYENLMIQSNVIHSAWQSGVKKLMFLGSSCIYPRLARQPMSEAELLTGLLEPTNEPYAIAKIAGIKMCESYCRQYDLDYRSIMPTNLFGPGDNYHLKNSHVIPALISKFHTAKNRNESSVSAWGTGRPLREFLFVDDMADAAIFLMNLSRLKLTEVTTAQQSHINVGSGEEISINNLTKIVAETIGFKGRIKWDSSKPDGAPRKLMDSSLLNRLGWSPKWSLRDGLKLTYADFIHSQHDR
ncbi:GDP-L-fucose synthase [Gammaproteobacteria bacterium]|nr:GDP-L-fucose synthase [Gammaproteobacteria bacterium]